MRNNHTTGIVGILLIVVGVLTQPGVSTALTTVLPPADATFVSACIAFAGAIAAYLGRPVTVPGPVTTTAKTTTEVVPPLPANSEEKVTTT